MWILNIIICLFYLQPSIGELKQVQTIFRHGNRTPTNGTNVYPNDPYVNETYEPDGLGALTNDGKRLAYKLGQYFRDRYDDFLGPFYSKKIIQFYSSEVDRVIMTGELVAAGLYPAVGLQRWNIDLNWQPVPVWPIPAAYNIYGGIFCKGFKKMVSNVEQTDEGVKRYIKENKDIYEYLSQHTGANITQDKVFNLRQILFAQRDIGLELPEWTKPVFPDGKLDELAASDIIIRSRTTKLKQLTGGIWIKELLKNVDNYINNSDTRKAFMYAAHELNIAYLLAALDNFDNQIPYYCNSIIFELHEEDNEYYVQIFYKNKDNLRTLQIPGCDDKLCPLDHFRKFVQPVIPQDMITLCESEN
ncbi:venom acid phosphatase Acph-1 isoform X2 [Megachile rotundata]